MAELYPAELQHFLFWWEFLQLKLTDMCLAERLRTYRDSDQLKTLRSVKNTQISFHKNKVV